MFVTSAIVGRDGWGAGLMMYEQSEIPLAIAEDVADDQGGSGFLIEGPSAQGTSLESKRVGLLAAPAAIVDTDRRIEEWIASNLDWNDPAPPRSPWIRLIDGLPGLKRPAREKCRETAAQTSLLGWNRFYVAYRRGITVVRLTDRSLVKEDQVRELACDLLDLIEAGNHRVVLNFQVVERLASWVVIAVDKARRLCDAADGGALKICGLPQQLASVFPIVGVALGKALHVDEAAAIDGPWPDQSGPRVLPIEILSAITSSGAIPPIRGGAPAEAAEVRGSRTTPAPHASPGGLDGLWLNVRVGGSQGRSVAVSGSRFVIGRDGSCQLRLASPLVSKIHAAIERKADGVVIEDLGSANGTIVNGRVLRNSEVPLNEGDRIQIGPIVVTVSVGPPRVEGGRVDEMVAGWLDRDGSAARSFHDDSHATELAATAGLAGCEPEPGIKSEIIQDVLVITPRTTELDADDSIELLRQHLHDLFEQSTPRHVVVNLECVRHLNAQAIGVLLAHHLRLDRVGGALRICQAHPRLMAMLHQVRLTILIEFHPTLDEAVLAAWPGEPRRNNKNG